MFIPFLIHWYLSGEEEFVGEIANIAFAPLTTV